MRRLKTTEVAATRDALLAQQAGRCGVCKLPINRGQEVLDHDHRTGAVRGTLHRGCNALLGKIENNAARYGVHNVDAFANGVASYLRHHLTNVTQLLHPTHRTAEEKRVLRNTRARKARAIKKQEAA